MRYVLGDMKKAGERARGLIGHIQNQLIGCKMPKAAMNGYEYIAYVDVRESCIHIFYANDFHACRRRSGSFVAQLEEGGLEIGSIDLFSGDIHGSIMQLIHEFWEKVCAITDKERSVMYVMNEGSY